MVERRNWKPIERFKEDHLIVIFLGKLIVLQRDRAVWAARSRDHRLRHGHPLLFTRSLTCL